MNTGVLPTGNNQRESASVLMLTIIAACLLGLTLGSYLMMVRAESVSVARSQAWTASEPHVKRVFPSWLKAMVPRPEAQG